MAKNSILLHDFPNENINRLPDGELSNNKVVETIAHFIDNCKNSPCGFSQLYESLKCSPFGLRDGYLPTLLGALFSSEKKV